MTISIPLETENESDTLHGIFPIPVLACKYELEHSSELNFIRNLDFKTAKKKMSVQTSANNYILNSPELLNIRRFTESKISYFIKTIMGVEADLTITQSWVNRLVNGAYHHAHTHPHSILSGVWYPARDIDFNPIVFMSEDNNKQVYLEQRRETPFHSTKTPLAVPRGESLLLIFPSTLRHAVNFNELATPRYSLSFNTWVNGSLGSKERLTYLPPLALDI